MFKEKCLKRIVDTGIIAVVRAEGPEQALAIAGAISAGGIDIIEITMTVPGALDVIRELVRAFPDGRLVVGAGTVLDRETARAALLAGAEYLVSPFLNQDMVRLANRYGKLGMPGAMTVTEIVSAMEAGADVVKLFPGDAVGPGYVKAVKGPLPHVRLIPTGGVSLDNVAEWMRNGCMAVGVGSELTGGAKKGDFNLVTQTARRFVEIIRDCRK